jgi:hypothetical protein
MAERDHVRRYMRSDAAEMRAPSYGQRRMLDQHSATTRRLRGSCRFAAGRSSAFGRHAGIRWRAPAARADQNT